MRSSIIERNPLAPVFLSIALSTIAPKASSSNISSTPSISNNFWYCFINEFFGSFNICTNACLSNSCSVATIGNLPINSGINPNFNKSCGNSSLNTSYLLISFVLSIFEPKPIDFLPVLSFMIFSNPSNAPPQIINIFSVLICINSWFGCFLPPCGGTDAIVPSIIFNNACCTPSPLTSLVIDGFSDFLVILSISSIYIIPFSAFCTSPSADWINFNKIFSTSSPTYPASVRVVASAIANGTSKIFAKVLASNVFPHPVGPKSNILLFCISTSSSFLLFSSWAILL